MDTKPADAVEHWHATVMRGGMVASVVVAREADGLWTSRAQLRDRSLNHLGDCWKRGSFATQAEALDAGQTAALLLHTAFLGMHDPPEPPRTIALAEPVGGYQSQALRRLARSQQRLQAEPSTALVPVPQPMRNAEMLA